jgi:hypothetical protein
MISMRTCYIYAIINSLTLDAYVGCTTRRLAARLSAHQVLLKRGEHPSAKLQAAWNIHRPQDFQAVVLLELDDVTKEAAGRIETIWIGRLGTYNEIGAEGWSGAMRENRGAHSKEYWADPAHRSDHGQKIKAAWADPQKRYANRRTRWVDPEQKAKHSEHMKALWADPERRQKLEARRAARWADPEAKARQGEKMRAYHAARRAKLSGV